MKKKAVFASFPVILMILAAVPLASSRAQSSDSGDAELDRIVARAMSVHGVPGAGVAVVKNAEVAWARGYGLADTEDGIPVDSETVFEAASVSKPVTAWGIMTLVEDGRIDLDAPISRYVKRWSLPPSEYDHDLITVRRILSHTAGLSEDGDTGVEPGQPVPTIEEALSGAIWGTRPLHVERAPGEDFHYASNAYSLLEMAVEEITGESFSTYMQREVLDPLGMRNSSYDWTPALRAQAAVGHDWYNHPLPEYVYSTRAQGSLRTTPADLAIFLAASMPGPHGEPVGRGVISPESVNEILTPVPFAKSPESSHVIGLGFDLIEVDGNVAGARKTGDHRGWKPLVVMDMAHGDGIVIMANSDRAAIGFLIDIACGWSRGLEVDLMRADCRELMTIRDVQLIIASVIALGALFYFASFLRGIRSGKRRPNPRLTAGRLLLVTLLLALLAAWWIAWHTDTIFTDILKRYPAGMAVTVRALVPWPTAFVWISRAVTLWFLAWIAAVFVPRVKKLDRHSVQ